MQGNAKSSSICGFGEHHRPLVGRGTGGPHLRVHLPQPKRERWAGRGWRAFTPRRSSPHQGLRFGGYSSFLFWARGKTFHRCLHPGTSSIRSLRFKTRAALPRVARIIEGFDGSSRRFTTARLVFIRSANLDLLIRCSLRSRSSRNATPRLSGRDSAPSSKSSSLKKSRKSVPR